MAHPSALTRSSRAVLRGLDFIYKTACDPEAFAEYGFDFLFSFYQIARSSGNPEVRRAATKMGRECARRWRRQHQSLPPGADSETITRLIFGSIGARGFGVDPLLDHSQVRESAEGFTSSDYFWFDSRYEAPPSDVPADCECGESNIRSSTTCSKCGILLEKVNRYEVWVVALIRSYLGEQFGAVLGCRYRDVIKWLPAMRPYPQATTLSDPDFVWSIYAATHVVYTLNNYNSLKLNKDWLPDEFAHLTFSLDIAIAEEDCETVGEILDSLKSFGVPLTDSKLQRGMQFLVSEQNRDGSWGDTDSDDFYDIYHPTLAAINGLDEYHCQVENLSFPELLPMLLESRVQ